MWSHRTALRWFGSRSCSRADGLATTSSPRDRTRRSVSPATPETCVPPAVTRDLWWLRSMPLPRTSCLPHLTVERRPASIRLSSGTRAHPSRWTRAHPSRWTRAHPLRWTRTHRLNLCVLRFAMVDVGRASVASRIQRSKPPALPACPARSPAPMRARARSSLFAARPRPATSSVWAIARAAKKSTAAPAPVP